MGSSDNDDESVDLQESDSGSGSACSPPAKKKKSSSKSGSAAERDNSRLAAQVLAQLSREPPNVIESQAPAKRPTPAPACTPVLGKHSGGKEDEPLQRGVLSSEGLKPKPPPLVRRPLVQLSANILKRPFKVPMANFTPSEKSKRATLGPRKDYSMMMGKLLGKITNIVPVDGTTAVEADEAEVIPLMLYDPAADTDAERRANLKAVYVERRLVAKLRPHQREGVQFMFNCLSGLKPGGYTGSILMDGMGLGKTFQAICTLWTMVTAGVNGSPTCSRPLILCPSSLVMNWGNELKRWLGPEHVDPLAMDDTRGAVVQEGLSKIWGSTYGGGNSRGPRKAQVLVMSYTTFRMHKDAVYNKRVDLVVCDEAHTLKNGDSQITTAVAGLPAVRRLLLSGTPVQNNLSELYTLFDVAVPGLLGPAAQFRRTYEGPILRSQDSDATELEMKLGAERGQQLLQLCGSYMLRRTCGVMAEYLPPKVEQVVFCKMSPLQVKLHRHFLESPHVKLLLSGGRAAARAACNSASAALALQGQGQEQQQGSSFTDFMFQASEPSSGPAAQAGPKSGGASKGRASGGRASGAGRASGGPKSGSGGPRGPRPPELSVLAAITAVKKLCCHPDLIYDMYAPKASLSILGRKASLTEKASSISAEAGNAAVITGFENCLPIFSQPSVSPTYAPGTSSPYHSGKVMVLMQLLKAIRTQESSDKVVLVSNYTEALDILGKLCQQNNWCTLRLDGSLSVKQRQPLVDRFNNPTDPSFVLLLSSKAGGVGLNIIGANRLVLFDPDWNPANDLQAMARIWREGQKKKVFIYRLLTTGSLEEKVYQRQLMKQDLSKSVVDDGNASGPQKGSFSTEELRALFKVDPEVACDTHSAIKCTCSCNKAAMELKIKQLMEKAAAETDLPQGSKDKADKPPDEKGVADWAHLKSSEILHGVDGIWKHLPILVREKFITFLFSDHTTNVKPMPTKGNEKEDEEDGKGKGACNHDDEYGENDDD